MKRDVSEFDSCDANNGRLSRDSTDEYMQYTKLFLFDADFLFFFFSTCAYFEFPTRNRNNALQSPIEIICTRYPWNARAGKNFYPHIKHLWRCVLRHNKSRATTYNCITCRARDIPRYGGKRLRTLRHGKSSSFHSRGKDFRACVAKLSSVLRNRRSSATHLNINWRVQNRISRICKQIYFCAGLTCVIIARLLCGRLSGSYRDETE